MSNEIPLGNKYDRETADSDYIKQRWNKVLIKLPVGKFTTSEVRLVKWMFSFVFVLRMDSKR